MYVPDLTGLRYAPSMHKSLPPIVSYGISGSFGEAAEHEEAANGCTGSSLARIAVDYNDVVLLAVEELEHFLAHLKKHIHGRRMVVFPVILFHHTFEFLVIVFPIAQVEDQV